VGQQPNIELVMADLPRPTAHSGVEAGETLVDL